MESVKPKLREQWFRQWFQVWLPYFTLFWLTAIFCLYTYYVGLSQGRMEELLKLIGL